MAKRIFLIPLCFILLSTSEILSSTPLVVSDLISAIHLRDLKIFKDILNQGANLEQRANSRTPIMYAAGYGEIEMVRLLISGGANVLARDVNNRTALMIASGNGHASVVEMLINHGAVVNYQSNYGETALMYAAAKGHVEVAKILIDNGAKTDFIDFYGRTAISVAVKYNHDEMVKLLSEHKRDGKKSND